MLLYWDYQNIYNINFLQEVSMYLFVEGQGQNIDYLDYVFPLQKLT